MKPSATFSPLTYAAVLHGLAQQAANYLAAQQTVGGRPDTGAVIRADWGLDDAGGTAGLVAVSLWTHLMRAQFPDLVRPEPDDETLAHRSLLALSYLEAVQRPSGLTDLRDCNYDSSPDAGFILQAIVPPLLHAQIRPPADTAWREVITRLTAFARHMTEGARDGGFHTPNHRWVIAAALHLSQKLFPDLPGLGTTINTYLAEGIDLDDEGFYIEHSAGVYDAICARSLLLLADRPNVPTPSLVFLVARNLQTDLCLLNPDGTVETGLSRRQDAGIVPPSAGNLAVPYLFASFLSQNPDEKHRFAQVAQWLWESTPPERRDYFGMSQVLVAQGEPTVLDDGAAPLPSCRKHFPRNGLWRLRENKTTASLFRDQTRLLNFRYGSAFLASVSIHQSYFGVGQFIAEEMEATDKQVRLITHGQSNPFRPGYDQPLGRPIAPERWKETRAERTVRRLPPAVSELVTDIVEHGLCVRYKTLTGCDRVTAQIALDFAVGGVWETGDTCFEPEAGQTIFLKNGSGTMRYPGGESIRVSPGADAHRMTRMRDAAPPAAPGLVRVLLTFTTPIDHTFTITGGTWPEV